MHTTSEHLTIQLHCRDALLSMDVPSVEHELNALLRHQSRVDGYEASLRSVLGVLRGGKGAGPRPQPPAPEPSGSDGPAPEPEPRVSTQQERAATKRAQLLEAHPYVAAALEAGRITTEQAEAICKAALPDEVKRQLLHDALAQSTDATLVAIKEAIAAADKADSEAKFRRQRANRSASWGKGDDGMYWIRALLDPVTGAPIIDVLDAMLTKETQANRTAKSTEIRTFAHMCADAVVAALTGETKPGRARVNITISADDLKAGKPGFTPEGAKVPNSVVLDLFDDAEILLWAKEPDSKTYSMWVADRLATRTQKQAITIRDGTCVWKDCDRRPSACDAHHLIEHANGGPTAVENLALLCPTHHRQLHRMGATLHHGSDDHQWQLRDQAGRVTAAWTNPAPAHARGAPEVSSENGPGTRQQAFWEAPRR
jgi:hypothetical protein